MPSELPNLSLAEMMTDPDASLKAARDAGGMVENEIGTWLLRHEAVRALGQSDKLRPSFSLVLEGLGINSGPFYEWMSISPLDMEGSEHRVWRQLMARAFTPRSVEAMRPFLREEAARLAAELAARGRCDFIEAFARRLPSAGLCELIGVPHEDRERFAGWADTIGFGFNPVLLPARIGQVDAALTRLLEYADELIAARRREPRDDLVTRIAQAVEQDTGIDEQAIRSSVAGLVFAGHETTKNQLGWMIVVLSEAADEWDRVAREPERARDVIEEVLRFRSTASVFGRRAQEDLELFGRPFPTGSSVMGSIWAANRDPAEFARPDEFAVDKNRDGVHLAFGQGAHHCLGAALARAELQESLIALARAIRCPRLEPGAEFTPPVGINGPSVLPIAFEPR